MCFGVCEYEYKYCVCVFVYIYTLCIIIACCIDMSNGSAVNVSEVNDSNPALKRIVSDSNLIARRFPGL